MARASNKGSAKPAASKSPKTVEQYPLDDDTRWRPIGAAYRRRFEQTENVQLSIFQLNDVLQSDRLHSKEQSVITGMSRLLPSTEWTDRIELRFLSGGPRVFHREPKECVIARRSQVVLLSVRDFQFFVWWPTVEKLWPTPKAFPETDGSSSPGIDEGYQMRRTAQALLDLYPDGKTQLPTAAVQRNVAAHLKDESQTLSLSAPSWHTVNRALGREK